MTQRIITSGPDQAYPQAQTAWQRERAGGRLQAMDEHGRPWTAWRLLGIAAVWLAIGAWTYVMLAVLP